MTSHCMTCSDILGLFERTLDVVRALPADELAKLRAAMLADAARDLPPMTETIQ